MNVLRSYVAVSDCIVWYNRWPKNQLACIQFWPSYIPGNCRADWLARTGALNWIDLFVPLASIKLDIEQKFFRDAKLSWLNEESCSTASLIWSLMDRRRTNQLLGLGRDVISTYPGSMRSPAPPLNLSGTWWIEPTNQLLSVGRDVISTTVAVLTGHFFPTINLCKLCFMNLIRPC